MLFITGMKHLQYRSAPTMDNRIASRQGVA
jgi:hypothetical protein